MDVQEAEVLEAIRSSEIQIRWEYQQSKTEWCRQLFDMS